MRQPGAQGEPAELVRSYLFGLRVDVDEPELTAWEAAAWLPGHRAQPACQAQELLPARPPVAQRLPAAAAAGD